MKFVSIIILLILSGCSQKSKENEKLILKTFWVNQKIQTDTARLDTAISIYGGAEILNFDSAQRFSSFNNLFYFHSDSIFWGEMGGSYYKGKWNIQDNLLILEKKFVSAVILMPNEKIGNIKLDTFKIKGDTLIRQDNEKFIPALNISVELQNFLKTQASR